MRQSEAIAPSKESGVNDQRIAPSKESGVNDLTIAPSLNSNEETVRLGKGEAIEMRIVPSAINPMAISPMAINPVRTAPPRSGSAILYCPAPQRQTVVPQTTPRIFGIGRFRSYARYGRRY
jgi:hypothetical protein